MPFFSIIVPTYNSAKTLEETIKSIINQDFYDFELLIMDGLSSDNTLQIANSFSDERIKFFSEKDNGVYEAMNKGIDKSIGEWIYFLGGDDTLYDNMVLKNILNFQKNENLNFIYGNAYFMNRKQVYDGEFDLDKLIFGKNICHQSIFYKKEFIMEIGKYNLNYKILADYEYNLRCFLNTNFKGKYFNLTVANFNDGIGLSGVTLDESFNEFHELIKNIKLRGSQDTKNRLLSKFGPFQKIVKLLMKIR